MGKGKILMLLFLGFGLLNAQNVIKKTILTPNTSYILIDAGNCFKLDLTTAISKEIIVEAIIDGEYKNDLLLQIEEIESTAMISLGFHPSFIKPNDKLSAHKVISISLKMQIPEKMKVRLNGTNCKVRAKGIYDYLNVNLEDGICILDNVSKSANVVTQSGDIYIRTKGAIIESKSNFGNVFKADIPQSNNYFKLFSNTGNIHLNKTE